MRNLPHYTYVFSYFIGDYFSMVHPHQLLVYMYVGPEIPKNLVALTWFMQLPSNLTLVF